MSKEAAAQTASVKNELNNISGVKGVSISYFALNSSDRYMNWERGTNEQRIQFDCLPVDYDFLQLMEIPIIEGRNFRPASLLMQPTIILSLLYPYSMKLQEINIL